MFGIISKPRLPVTQEQQRWVDYSFLRLSTLLGSRRMLDAVVVLPTAQFFPDTYDRSEDACRKVLCRVAAYMEVDAETINLEVFDDTAHVTHSLLPFSSGDSQTAGGLYVHESSEKANILINASKLKDPEKLVATLAHELGHVILLRPGLVDSNSEDMEPLNDLLTVFLGLGIFNANSAFQFTQYTNNDSQGWSVNRSGYLSEELYGYSLARFAFERNEADPKWAKHLATNIKVYFKQASAWLRLHGERLGLQPTGGEAS